MKPKQLVPSAALALQTQTLVGDGCGRWLVGVGKNCVYSAMPTEDLQVGGGTHS